MCVCPLLPLILSIWSDMKISILWNIARAQSYRYVSSSASLIYGMAVLLEECEDIGNWINVFVLVKWNGLEQICFLVSSYPGSPGERRLAHSVGGDHWTPGLTWPLIYNSVLMFVLVLVPGLNFSCQCDVLLLGSVRRKDTTFAAGRCLLASAGSSGKSQGHLRPGLLSTECGQLSYRTGCCDCNLRR